MNILNLPEFEVLDTIQDDHDMKEQIQATKHIHLLRHLVGLIS